MCADIGGFVIGQHIVAAGTRVDQQPDACGPVRRIDVMRTSHPMAPISLVSISGGFEGRFLHHYARLRSFGRALAGLAALGAAKGHRGEIALQLDGETVLHTGEVVFSAGLYNTPYYVGGILMSPDADVADGMGESVVYRTAVPYWTAVLTGLRRAAPPPHTGVLRRRWRVARIESEHPLQIDGEAIAADALSISMEPHALPVVVSATLTTTGPPSKTP